MAAARDAMAADKQAKNLLGAAGEGAYRHSLTARGVSNASLDGLVSARNFSYLDIVSREGVAQVKAYNGNALKTYDQTLRALIDPTNHSGGIAAGIRNSEKAAQALWENRFDLASKGVWPTGLSAPKDVSVAQVLSYFRQESKLAIPNDQIPGLRRLVGEEARALPGNYGLSPGPALEAEIQKLLRRIEPIGLTLDELNALELAYRGRPGDAQ